MKKIMLLLLLGCSIYLAKAQTYTSADIKSYVWKENVVLILDNEQSKDQIKILVNKVILKMNNLKYIPLQINDNNYQVAIGKGVTHLLNDEGIPVAMTDQGRNKIFFDNKSFLREAKPFKKVVRYYDDSGKLVVEGKLKNNKIVLENFSSERNDYLIAMCLEEMIRNQLFGNPPLTPLIAGQFRL